MSDTATATAPNAAKVITPKFRAAFASVFRPKGVKGDPNSTPKYSITMLFGPDADLKPLKQLVLAAAQKKWGANADATVRHPKFKSPFKDQGSVVNGEGVPYSGFVAGQVCVQAATTIKPGLIDANRQDIIDERDFYSGCYAVASVTAYAWSHPTGGNGVSFDLNNVMKVSDGDPLTATRAKAHDDFEHVQVEGAKNAGSLFD